ncbi:unnamed protein product [Caenorhabditis brenneri]
MLYRFFHMQNVTGLSLVLYRFTSVHFLTSDEKWKRWYSCVPVFGTLYSFAVLTPWWYFGPLVTTIVIGIAYIFVPPASILQIQMIVVTFTSDMVTLAMPYILFTFDSNIRRLLKLEPSQIPIGMTSCTGRTITNYVVNN